MARRAPTGRAGPLAHPLTYVRQERNWTHQDVVDVIAHRLNTATRREKAWRWEHWGVQPDAQTQAALADELGVPVEQVRRLGWPHWLPVGERIDLDSPWTVDGSLTLLDATAGAAVMDRRGFMILSVGGAVAMADEWLAIEAPQLTAVLRGGRLDGSLVDCFERRLPALRRMDAMLGGGSVRGMVDAELRLVTDLLSKGSYTETVGKRLFVVAAELARVAGWASFDAGYHAAAERYWTAALRAAHTAGDRPQGANILKCMSLQRVDTGRTDEALALARAARTGAQDAPARVVAMLTVRQARTHAILGEASACERLLAEAETKMSRADQDDSPPWAEYFDAAEYSAQVGACYLTLRRYDLTDRWLAQSLATQPEERSRDRATYLIWRADAALHRGDLEHACSLVGQAVPDIAAARSARNQRRLTRLHSELRTHPHRAVDALDGQLRELRLIA